MSTFYAKSKVSSCEIAGAIAAAAQYDLVLNNFTFSGFPGVRVETIDDQHFRIHMFIEVPTGFAKESFSISRADAMEAAKLFQKTQKHLNSILKPVQTAISKLEAASQASRM